MRKVASLFLTITALMAFAATAFAADSAPGRVKRIVVGSTGADQSYITIGNFRSFGGCATDADGRIKLAIENGAEGDRQLAIATAAFLSGKYITVWAGANLNGFCRLDRINLEVGL